MAHFVFGFLIMVVLLWTTAAPAQLIDRTQQPSTTHEGIAESFAQEIGPGVPSPGRGDITLPGSSAFIISRDPFRSIRRGRQLFQRKFTQVEGQGPRLEDGTGDVSANLDRAAGLADSCAGCHGRPRGAAGFGGSVATRPDSRDAPHLFGLGLKEMLADEITADLRAIGALAITEAQANQQPATKLLTSKGIAYGSLTATPSGTVDTTNVHGVNTDLRVRPFLAHGGKISTREFIVGASQAEMGLHAVVPDLAIARSGGRVTTPGGMVLDGALDELEAPPTNDPPADLDGDEVTNEVPASIVDHFEFHLLNDFKPATYEQTRETGKGGKLLDDSRHTACHIPHLRIAYDRRVVDVDTAFDPGKGGFNGLSATATPLFSTSDDGKGFPPLTRPPLGTFLVKNVFTDFKRHDLGPNFSGRNYDGTPQREFLTTPLWGVGSTAPYGHDGRSITLKEVILRHGGEALSSAQALADVSARNQERALAFLNSLVLFPTDETSSNLDPANPATPCFPHFGHGNIKLPVSFNVPNDLEWKEKKIAANTLATAAKAERPVKTNSSHVKHGGGERTGMWNASHTVRYHSHTFGILSLIYPRFPPFVSRRVIAWHTHATPKK